MRVVRARPAEVLIEQDVAIVLSVCDIVDYHETVASGADGTLPARVERVVVDDEPIER